MKEFAACAGWETTALRRATAGGFAREPGVPLGRAKPSCFARRRFDFGGDLLSALASMPRKTT
jgi:hypothetical protein